MKVNWNQFKSPFFFGFPHYCVPDPLIFSTLFCIQKLFRGGGPPYTNQYPTLIGFNLLSIDFKLLSVDFQLISIYAQLISIYFQLKSIYFQLIFKLISIYFQLNDLLSLDFNLLSIGFNLLSIDFNLLSIDFNLLSLDFNLLSIDFHVLSTPKVVWHNRELPKHSYYWVTEPLMGYHLEKLTGCCFFLIKVNQASNYLETLHFKALTQIWFSKVNGPALLTEMLRKVFCFFSTPKAVWHNRVQSKHSYYWVTGPLVGYHLEKLFGCCFLIMVNQASNYLENLAF